MHIDHSRPRERTHKALPRQEAGNNGLAGLPDGVVHVLRPAHKEAVVDLAHLQAAQLFINTSCGMTRAGIQGYTLQDFIPTGLFFSGSIPLIPA